EGAFDGIGRMFSSAARDIGKFAQQAAPAVAHIGGGVLQGAMAGSAAGLPGIIAGAAVGGAGAGLSRYGKGAARQVGGALSGVTSLAGQFTPMGQAGAALGSTLSGLGGAAAGKGGRSVRTASPGTGAAGGIPALGQIAGLLTSPQAAAAVGGLFGGNRAANQFASTLQRPEVQQALAAMRLGPLGRSAIPVGSAQTPVPTGGFAQLLSHLVQQMATEAADIETEGEAESAAIEFMSDGAGGFVGDPALPSSRAARLWGMLNEAQSERLVEAMDSVDHDEVDDSEADFADADEGYGADDEYYDALDLADAEDIDYALSQEDLHYAR
ncbi:MAG TPA: hypothetical protein VGU70_03805, partial [Methylobacterium sp.]|nr:hypothetical protein [Methylobacterium sp.]